SPTTNPRTGRPRTGTGSRCQIDEVDHNLVTTQAVGKLVFLDLGGDNDNLAASRHFFTVSAKTRTDMGYHFLNILAVRAGQPPQRYVTIPYPNLAALPQQPFNHLHLGALPEVAGPGFEA